MFKRLFLLLIFVLFITSISNAACYFNCSGFPGTVCVDDKCVPIGSVSTPTPTPIPTTTPYPSDTALYTIQRIYCGDKVCIVIVMPPSSLVK